MSLFICEGHPFYDRNCSPIFGASVFSYVGVNCGRISSIYAITFGYAFGNTFQSMFFHPSLGTRPKSPSFGSCPNGRGAVLRPAGTYALSDERQRNTAISWQ